MRKLDFDTDHRKKNEVVKIDHPRATRLIEAIAKPKGVFSNALLSDRLMDMNNHNIVVDSYDSRDPAKSTGGFYDVNKRQQNGHVATNGQAIEAGSAHVYGDAATNQGQVFNSDNVTGTIRDDFYMDITPVDRPNTTPDIGTPTQVTGSTVITAKSGNSAHYQLDRINLSGSGALTIRGAADGSDTFVEIVVTGDINMSGQAQIILDPGVHARFFVAGNADMTGQGVTNPNSPLNLQLYGLRRPALANGNIDYGSFRVTGNGGFRGTVYAPHHDLTMVGGGNSDSIFGAFVGHDIRMTGNQAVHYDEALADGGLINDYGVVSWFEDAR